MNLRDLKYLVAVAEYRNFRKAAEACFISQPTLSMQLKKLEEYLQIQLIERDNRNVLLTPAGNQIVEKAKLILDLEKQIKDSAKSFQNPFEGDVRIGAFPTLAPYYFPKIMPKINKAFPKLKVYLFEEKTEILIDKLEQGKIDFAFLATPVNSLKLSHQIVFAERFLVAVSDKNELVRKYKPIAPTTLTLPRKQGREHGENLPLLAGGDKEGGKERLIKKVLTVSDIATQNLLLLEDGHCLREQALEFCTINSLAENSSFRATSLETLRQMVVSNMGITLVPEIAAVETKGIKYLPLDKSIKAGREIGLYFRDNSYYQNIAKVYLKQIVS